MELYCGSHQQMTPEKIAAEFANQDPSQELEQMKDLLSFAPSGEIVTKVQNAPIEMGSEGIYRTCNLLPQ